MTERFQMKVEHRDSVLYLTAFPLPENGRLWVPSGLTLEGDGSANADHLVPWSDHKRRGHWRADRMVNDRIHRYINRVSLQLSSEVCIRGGGVCRDHFGFNFAQCVWINVERRHVICVEQKRKKKR